MNGNGAPGLDCAWRGQQAQGRRSRLHFARSLHYLVIHQWRYSPKRFHLSRGHKTNAVKRRELRLPDRGYGRCGACRRCGVCVGDGMGDRVKRDSASAIAQLFEQSRQFHRRLYIHLVENMCTVHFDGAHADAQCICDDLVHFAGEDEIEYFAFAH